MEQVTDIERDVFDTISKDIGRLHIRSRRNTIYPRSLM